MAKKKQQPAEPEANPSFDQKLANIPKRNGLQHHDGPEPQTGTKKTLVIKKAKIVDDLTLDVDYHESIVLITGTKRKDIGGSNSRKGDNAVHQDLRDAFTKLNVHLALMSEIVKGAYADIDFVDKNQYKDFRVTGFSCGSSDDGITLIGQKTLSTGKILNLTTPYEGWENSPYQFIGVLGESVAACKHEVELYLDGKMAPPAQKELEFEEGEKTAEETEA